MTAAIWSAPPAAIEALPAHFILGFYRNHGLLQLSDRPQWRTIVGGARRYVEALLNSPSIRLRLSVPIREVVRVRTGIELTTSAGTTENFDAAVLACHADQALRMLADATADERRILSAFPYQANEAVVHTDPSVMPRRRRAWASWNYAAGPTNDGERSVTVTYHLNRLQGFKSPRPVFVTLNPLTPICDEHVIKRLQYTHPAYSVASVAAQREHATINGRGGVYFCGAYWGYGFHEDGVRSAMSALATLVAK
jgi:predicted NAD/FAD-binding protein